MLSLNLLWLIMLGIVFVIYIGLKFKNKKIRKYKEIRKYKNSSLSFGHCCIIDDRGTNHCDFLTNKRMYCTLYKKELPMYGKPCKECDRDYGTNYEGFKK